MVYPGNTLGGIKLIASSPVHWEFTYGTQPYIGEFDIMPGDAKALLEFVGTPISLSMNEGNDPVVVSALYVLGIYPSENPTIFRVRVADRRVWWPWGVIVRGFNVRRNVGVKRIIATNTPELNPVGDLVQYAWWSLKDKNLGVNGKWRTREAVEDVMNGDPKRKAKGVLDIEGDWNGAKAQLFITDAVGAKLEKLPIEGLEFHEKGDQAVNRMLAYLPECDITVNKRGDVVIDSKATGFEQEVVRALGKEIVGRGHVSIVSNEAIRPEYIDMLFDVKAELRFNYLAEGSTSITTYDRFMENVAPSPDYVNIINGQTIPTGTYLPLQTMFDSPDWAGLSIPGGRLTHAFVRRAMAPFMDLWACVELSGKRTPDVDWAARIATVMGHWRRTFRINSKWMDNIRSIEAYRLATIDPISGQRAPAMAWSDYCVLPSEKYLWKQISGDVNLAYVVNVKGFPASGVELGLETKPAPAIVTILDHDQGIIHLDYQVDPYRNFEMVLPGLMEVNGTTTDSAGYPQDPGPTGNLRRRDYPISFNAVLGSGSTRWPQLTANHNVSVILTASPASPNDTRRLYRVRVFPQDIQNLLPNAFTAGLGNCKGPPMQVYVGPGVEVARVRWLDSAASRIEALFGITDTPPNIDDLVMNLDPNPLAPNLGASLNSIARARAAGIYAALVDRQQGAMSGMMNPAIDRPYGYIDRVVHEVNVDAEATTSLALPERLSEWDLMSLLDQSTRALILRLVDGRSS